MRKGENILKFMAFIMIICQISNYLSFVYLIQFNDFEMLIIIYK